MGLLSRLFPASTPARSPASAPASSTPAPAADLAVGLAAFFSGDHAACDQLWAEVEAAETPEGAVAAFHAFDTALRRHLGWEEDVIFPAFEDASGHRGFGPTMVMRGEHIQMRAVLDEMARCAASGDQQGMIDQGDTLLMLIQQHNAKEEGMLYPMAEGVLGGAWRDLRGRLRE